MKRGTLDILHLQAKDINIQEKLNDVDTIIFIDTLFATTTIVNILYHHEVSVKACSNLAEFNNSILEGALGITEPKIIQLIRDKNLVDNSTTLLTALPFRLSKESFQNVNIAFLSTNGTPALAKLKAHNTYISSLNNFQTTCSTIKIDVNAKIAIICAGNRKQPSIEDDWTAGVHILQLISLYKNSHNVRIDVNANNATKLYRKLPAKKLITFSPVAQMAIKRGDEHEVERALTLGCCDIAIQMNEDCLLFEVTANAGH